MIVRNDSNIENEIKLDLLTSFNLELLLDKFGNPIDKIRQFNYFFDTKDMRLNKSDWALRVRIEERDSAKSIARVTAKGKSTQIESIASRPEYEEEIPLESANAIVAGSLDFTELKLKPLEVLSEFFGSDKLIPLLSFENYRWIFPYVSESDKSESNELELALDKTSFGDGHIDYELELEGRDPEFLISVEKSMRNLFEKIEAPFIPQRISKFKRAMNRLKLQSSPL